MGPRDKPEDDICWRGWTVRKVNPPQTRAAAGRHPHARPGRLCGAESGRASKKGVAASNIRVPHGTAPALAMGQIQPIENTQGPRSLPGLTRLRWPGLPSRHSSVLPLVPPLDRGAFFAGRGRGEFVVNRCSAMAQWPRYCISSCTNWAARLYEIVTARAP